MTLFFNRANVVTDWDVASRSDTARYAKYFWGLLERGVYMPCSQYEALFISAAHQPSRHRSDGPRRRRDLGRSWHVVLWSVTPTPSKTRNSDETETYYSSA